MFCEADHLAYPFIIFQDTGNSGCTVAKHGSQAISNLILICTIYKPLELFELQLMLKLTLSSICMATTTSAKLTGYQQVMWSPAHPYLLRKLAFAISRQFFHFYVFFQIENTDTNFYLHKKNPVSLGFFLSFKIAFSNSYWCLI